VPVSVEEDGPSLERLASVVAGGVGGGGLAVVASGVGVSMAVYGKVVPMLFGYSTKTWLVKLLKSKGKMK
jgi:hypothetical protein